VSAVVTKFATTAICSCVPKRNGRYFYFQLLIQKLLIKAPNLYILCIFLLLLAFIYSLIIQKEMFMTKNKIIQEIQTKIFFARNQRVMIDSEAAFLYGVSIERLKSAVKKNAKRFSTSFMFQLTKKEWQFFKPQISVKTNKSKTLPYFFTLSGIAMLANVLNSKKAFAISANIAKSFARIFIQRTAPLWINENNKEFKIITKGLCSRLQLINKKK
jgi:hypothetical protein